MEDTMQMQHWGQLLSAETSPTEVTAHVGLSRHDRGIAVVTLARPEKKNALSLSSWRRLAEIFAELRCDEGLRVVVVRGAGSEAFGAGADIAEFPDNRMTAAAAVAYNESISKALTAVGELPVPVIAMIRGLAVGGGCELAAACDVRIASDNARFGIPIGRLGVTLGYVEAKALVRLIGAGQLKRLLFEGELLDAREAAQIGLVEICVEDSDLERRTAAMVEAITTSAPVTIRAAKLVADMCDRPLTANDTEQLVRATVEAYEGADLREGVAAFLQRRRPQFNNEKEGQ